MVPLVPQWQSVYFNKSLGQDRFGAKCTGLTAALCAYVDGAILGLGDSDAASVHWWDGREPPLNVVSRSLSHPEWLDAPLAPAATTMPVGEETEEDAQSVVSSEEDDDEGFALDGRREGPWLGARTEEDDDAPGSPMENPFIAAGVEAGRARLTALALGRDGSESAEIRPVGGAGGSGRGGGAGGSLQPSGLRASAAPGATDREPLAWYADDAL